MCIRDRFIIGITGSNGKTTTTELIYHILKQSGLNVGMAGNIGTSFSKQVAENSFDYYVLEISSFQLDDIIDFKPNIALITNLIEDHLDRYNYDFANYIDSKLRITMNQENADNLLYNIDDKLLKDDDLKKRYKKISERRVKLGLLMQHIASEEKVVVSEEEINKGILEYTRQYPGQEKQIMEYFEKNPSSLDTIRAPLIEQKVIDSIISKSKTNVIKLSEDEYKKLEVKTFNIKDTKK